MDIVWAPDVIEDVDDDKLSQYLDFAATACVPGGGCDVEQALQVLYIANGDINLAMEKLLNNQRVGPSSWTDEESSQFGQLFALHGKDFAKISQHIPTRSRNECVQFYYLWKRAPIGPISPLRWNTPVTRSSSSTAASSSSSPSTINSPSLVTSNTTTSSSPTESTQSPLNNTNASSIIDINDIKFPCRVCGRVFEKVKSRSAHMKRHKNERWR